jgi:hypothetical protein
MGVAESGLVSGQCGKSGRPSLSAMLETFCRFSQRSTESSLPTPDAQQMWYDMQR